LISGRGSSSLFSGIGWLSMLPYEQQWWWKNNCCKEKLNQQPEEAYLKFVMLCAKKYFQRYYTLTFCVAERICRSYLWVFVHYLLQVTRDAYVVILAGGNLQPIEETRLRLCPSLPPADIKFFQASIKFHKPWILLS